LGALPAPTVLYFSRRFTVALSDIDRDLLQRCLARKPKAWEDFVDRFLGLVIHVIDHSAAARSIGLSPEENEDLAAEVFLAIVSNDFAVLRRFRGESSLATYLTVVARRVVVRDLIKRKPTANLGASADGAVESHDRTPAAEERVGNRDEIESLMSLLSGDEAHVVRMYHLEGQSYHDISVSTGLPENSIGPLLSRARAKMRRAAPDAAHS
jgi:RNA polymerase sigma-70 factor (ECF subfamily)